MNILGYILIVLGGIYSFGRLLNQPTMFRKFVNNYYQKGFLKAVYLYLRVEQLGLGIGILLIYFGLKLIK
jgi:hypothetical protein